MKNKMKKLFSTKKGIAAGVLSIAIIAGTAGIAAAYFTSTGSGSATAQVGSATAWGVVVGTAAGGPLYPGTGTETQNYTITNAGSGAQALPAVAATVGNSGSCLGSWFTAVASAPVPATGVSIAPAGTATGTVTITMQDSGTLQDACQGVITLPVTVHAS